MTPTAAWAPRRAPSEYLAGRAWQRTSALFEALGYRFAVRSDEDAGFEHLETVFEVFSPQLPQGDGQASWYSILDRGRDRGRYASYRGEVRLAVSQSLPYVVGAILWDFNRAVTEVAGTRYTVMHAAAARGNDATVLLPAPMESGKTTTVAGLLADGFSYYTDEAAAIDPESGLLVPFPKALAIDPGSWPVLHRLGYEPGPMELIQWHVPCAAVGAEVAPAAEVDVIIEPRYHSGAKSSLIRVPRAAALTSLLQSTFDLRSRPARDIPVAADVVRGANCYLLTIGDLDQAVDLVRSAVGLPPRGHNRRPEGEH